MKGHKITGVVPESIADELEITGGDLLLSVNGHELKDVFDYHYLVNDEQVVLLIQKPDGEEWELEIEKDFDEDIGIIFEDALLDDYRSCSNKCIFCFIDQMPQGMRDTLYFKDDDARLSFLQGNYITLTNMSDADIERIIRFHLAPINVSVHTTNPELRVKMLHNRFAGIALEKLFTLYNAGIEMNSQVVLVKDVNDGEELDRTIRELADLHPAMESLSVVPIGITAYRKNLTKVQKFNKEDSIKVVHQIEAWQEKFKKELGTRFVHASDEWYITAGLPLPPEEYYEGYGQIENGIGMARSFIDEFNEGLKIVRDKLSSGEIDPEKFVNKAKKIVCITGFLFGPYLKDLVKELNELLNVNIIVKVVINLFFGPDITVTGLVTGQDIIWQLGKDMPEIGRKPDLVNREDIRDGRVVPYEELKEELKPDEPMEPDYIIIPEVMLRSGEEVFLDDLTVTDVAKALQTRACIVKSDGVSCVEGILECLEGSEDEMVFRQESTFK